ncbi:MAG TPA: response regulator transcription factor [Anaerolineae bacterium]|nr:response regulator transcription factor [Anaerolineae bacterium]HQK12971.1 response regulator transcription factor [Anaerolineae bacterium]
MIKLLIVDNHDLVREALQKRLATAVGLEVVGSTGRYEDALRQAQMLAPDVILMEIKAPEGLQTLQTLRRMYPECAVIVLTSYPDSQEEDQVRQMGAASYLLKTLDTKVLVREIRNVARLVKGEALPY